MKEMMKNGIVELSEEALQNVTGGDFESVNVNDLKCPSCGGDLMFDGIGTITVYIFEESVWYYKCPKCGTLYRRDMCHHWIKIKD